MGQVKDKIYAFVALERIGGIMVYDVTDPGNVSYVNYINSRDFATTIPGSEEYEDDELDKWVTGGDVAPEGLAFVSAAESPTGKDLLLAACEVSGTLAVYEMTGHSRKVRAAAPHLVVPAAPAAVAAIPYPWTKPQAAK